MLGCLGLFCFVFFLLKDFLVDCLCNFSLFLNDVGVPYILLFHFLSSLIW